MTRFVMDDKKVYYNLDKVSFFGVEKQTLFRFRIYFNFEGKFYTMGGGSFTSRKDAEDYLIFLLTGVFKILCGSGEEE